MGRAKGQPKVPGSGRKPYKPTDEQRAFVSIGIAGGFRIEDVAGALKIDTKTLRKHFPDEVRHAKTVRNVRIVSALYKSAEEGNVTAQIYLTKTQLGWREVTRLEHSGSISMADLVMGSMGKTGG